jgi:hypothetical protein
MAAKRKSTAKPKNRPTTRKTRALNTKRKGSPGTKMEAIIGLLSRSKGASVAQLQKATGWQPHSLRAALTGLRQKGFDIQRTKDAKEVTVYSVTKASQ